MEVKGGAKWAKGTSGALGPRVSRDLAAALAHNLFLRLMSCHNG